MDYIDAVIELSDRGVLIENISNIFEENPETQTIKIPLKDKGIVRALSIVATVELSEMLGKWCPVDVVVEG